MTGIMRKYRKLLLNQQSILKKTEKGFYCSPLQVAIQFHKFEIALLIAQKMIKHNTPKINQHIAHAYNLVNDPAFKKCSELKEYHDLKNTLRDYLAKDALAKILQHIEAVTVKADFNMEQINNICNITDIILIPGFYPVYKLVTKVHNAAEEIFLAELSKLKEFVINYFH